MYHAKVSVYPPGPVFVHKERRDGAHGWEGLDQRSRYAAMVIKAPWKTTLSEPHSMKKGIGETHLAPVP